MLWNSGLEIDGYDLRSLHMVALRDGVVGTARLILDGPFSPLQEEQARWCASIVRDAGPAIRERVERGVGAPLPVFATDAPRPHWERLVSPVAELSRVVVDPQLRGNGISKALIATAIEEVARLGCAVVLVECIPVHEAIYSRYGFRRINWDTGCRGGDLDQSSIGMYRNLSEAMQRLDPFGNPASEWVSKADLNSKWEGANSNTR